MGSQSRVINLFHLLMVFEELGNRNRVALMFAHTQRQGLYATQCEVAVKRTRHGASGILNEFQLVVKFLITRNNCTANNVTVPTQILGRAVHDDIGAKLQRALEVRRSKGIIDDVNEFMSFANSTNGFQLCEQ